MKKTTLALGIVVLAGAAYAGSAWYVGKQAQTTIREGVTQTNDRVLKMIGPDLNSSHFNIEIRDYERGVFSSTAQYVVHTRDSDGSPIEYVLQDHLQHGPFPWAALSEGKLAPMLAYSQAQMQVTPAVQEWFDAHQGQTPLSIKTQVGFDGRGVSYWMFSPFEISRDQRRVSFSGGYIEIVFSNEFNNNVATGHFDLYAFTDSVTGEKVEVRDISLNSTTERMADRQIEHRSTAQIKTFTVAGSPDTQPVEMNELDVEVSSAQKGGFLDAHVRYDIARILVEGADLGQMTASGSITQLNLDALSRLQASYAEMAAERGPDTEPGFLLTQDEQLVLQEMMRPILAAAPTIAVDPVVWKNSSGQSQASVFLALRDPGELDSANAARLLQKMLANAKLDLAVDRAMVVEFFQQVAASEDTDRSQAGESGGQLFDEYADLLTQLGITQLENNTLTLALDAFPSEDKIVLNGEAMTTEQLMVLGMGLLFMY